MKDIIIKGDSPDQKFKHIEKILTKMLRRSRKHVIAVMPSIPLFFAVDEIPESGIIFEWLFPTDGTITKVCLAIREFGDEPLKFVALIDGATGGRHRTFETKKPITVDRLDLPIESGDRLTLRVDNPEGARGIWVSFLFEMNIRDAVKEPFLFDELEKITDKEVEEIENG